MSIPKLENLDIKKVTENILLVHQIKHPFFFSCCDGLLILPKKGRNNSTISLDLNIEAKYVNILNKIYGPISDYVCSHGHLDHTCHVHSWEKTGALIHAPYPESNFLLDLHNFYEGFGWDQEVPYHTVERFGKLNGYVTCSQVNTFSPEDSFSFENLTIDTISLSGHSKAHVGFLIPEEKVFHISCLGFDKPKPDIEGFGPWYGFEQCSIPQYLRDIEKAKEIFLKDAKFLTSSHSYVVSNPDINPFEYMRKKIQDNQEKMEKALKDLNISNKSENEIVKELLKMDLFFPKRKFKGVVLDIYRFWESWIIKNHIRQIGFNRNK